MKLFNSERTLSTTPYSRESRSSAQSARSIGHPTADPADPAHAPSKGHVRRHRGSSTIVSRFSSSLLCSDTHGQSPESPPIGYVFFSYGENADTDTHTRASVRVQIFLRRPSRYEREPAGPGPFEPFKAYWNHLLGSGDSEPPFWQRPSGMAGPFEKRSIANSSPTESGLRARVRGACFRLVGNSWPPQPDTIQGFK